MKLPKNVECLIKIVMYTAWNKIIGSAEILNGLIIWKYDVKIGWKPLNLLTFNAWWKMVSCIGWKNIICWNNIICHFNEQFIWFKCL